MGKLDAAWEIEPLATSAEDRGIAQEVIWAGQLFPNYDPFLIVESPQFAQSQPEALKRFTTAQLRGQRDYLEGFDKLEDSFLRVGTLQPKVDVSTVIDPAPVEYALQRLGWVS